MIPRYHFPPDVLALVVAERAWAEAQGQALDLMVLVLDGTQCPTPKDFLEHLAQTVQFSGDELSLSILGQELANLDWLAASRFGIWVARADHLFARGNRYMWQYLLEMAWNIQRNVEDFQRPPIHWWLQMEKSQAAELQAFFEKELGFIVEIQVAE